jgi:hypothetical protein
VGATVLLGTTVLLLGATLKAALVLVGAIVLLLGATVNADVVLVGATVLLLLGSIHELIHTSCVLLIKLCALTN